MGPDEPARSAPDVAAALASALAPATEHDPWVSLPWTDGRDWQPPPPRDMPALRAEIIDNLHTDVSRALMLKHVGEGKSIITRHFPHVPAHTAALGMLEEEVERLRDATLFYFTADMTEECLDAAASLPDDWRITAADLPESSESGLILYERPIYEYSHAGDNAERVKIVAASWGPTAIQAPYGCVWATYWSATDYHALVANLRYDGEGELIRAKLAQAGITPDLARVQITRSAGHRKRNYAAEARELRPPISWDNETLLMWGPDGRDGRTSKRGMSTLGGDPNKPLPPFGHPDAGTLDFNRVLMASWLMMQQQDKWVDVEYHTPNKREQRRLSRDGHPTGGVRVVSLKPAMRRPAGDTAGDTPQRGRLVKRQRVRGHWRRLFGEDRTTVRRRVWVKRHERGPQGNGYYDTQRVNVVGER